MKVKDQSSKVKSTDQRSKVLNFKLYFLLFTFAFLFFMTGCAKTATTIFGPGETPPKMITFDITFTGSAEQSLSAAPYYFIILSDSQQVSIPGTSNNPSDPFYEPYYPPFAFPATTGLPDYYSRYFSTWKNYIAINAAQFVNGPFITSEAIPTRESITTVPFLPNNITLTFTISMEAPTGNQLWFDIVSVDSNQHVQDNSLYSVNTKSGTSVSGNGQFYIGSWEVYVQ